MLSYCPSVSRSVYSYWLILNLKNSIYNNTKYYLYTHCVLLLNIEMSFPRIIKIIYTPKNKAVQLLHCVHVYRRTHTSRTRPSTGAGAQSLRSFFRIYSLMCLARARASLTYNTCAVVMLSCILFGSAAQSPFLSNSFRSRYFFARVWDRLCVQALLSPRHPGI